MLKLKGTNHDDGTFNWKDALIDAFIIAMLTFFTSLGGLGVTSPITFRDIIGAAIASCAQFFTILALKRGLREKQT